MSVEATVINSLMSKVLSLIPAGTEEHDLLVEAAQLLEPAIDKAATDAAPVVEHAAEAAVEAQADKVLPAPVVEAIEHAVDPNNPGGVTYPWLHPSEAQPEHAAAGATEAQPEHAAAAAAGVIAGAGAVMANHPDLPAPQFGQNVNDNPGGYIDQAHASDCGEQCCAMVLYSTRGVEVPEEVIRAYIQGSPNSAYGNTNAGQLARYLSGPHCHLNAESDPRPYPHARDTIEAEISQGHLVIALGEWISPGYGHWMVFRGYAANGVRYNDPWFGNERGKSWSDFEGQYWGQLVLIHEPARYS